MMSPPLLVAILLADFAITLLHSYQEWKGEGAPLWRNFGAIVGLNIPDRWGFRLFTLGLTVVLFALGFTGIVGLFGPCATAVALGALVGARLSDTFISHVLVYSLGYRPNPGLSSTPLYVLEALFIFFIFHVRLAAEPGWSWLGFAFGVLGFLIVLPSLWLATLACPACQRPRWQPWEPMPAWATVDR
jgi:hypothetical protein